MSNKKLKIDAHIFESKNFLFSIFLGHAQMCDMRTPFITEGSRVRVSPSAWESLYTWITVINYFNNGFNRVQKKASDKIGQEYSLPRKHKCHVTSA